MSTRNSISDASSDGSGLSDEWALINNVQQDSGSNLSSSDFVQVDKNTVAFHKKERSVSQSPDRNVEHSFQASQDQQLDNMAAFCNTIDEANLSDMDTSLLRSDLPDDCEDVRNTSVESISGTAERLSEDEDKHGHTHDKSKDTPGTTPSLSQESFELLTGDETANASQPAFKLESNNKQLPLFAGNSEIDGAACTVTSPSADQLLNIEREALKMTDILNYSPHDDLETDALLAALKHKLTENNQDPRSSDSDSDYVCIDPAHTHESPSQTMQGSGSSVGSDFNFLQPHVPVVQEVPVQPPLIQPMEEQNIAAVPAVGPPPLINHNQGNLHDQQPLRNNNDDFDPIPEDIDDRCESDISGNADDDESDALPALNALALGPARASRQYRHRPNNSLNSTLNMLLLAALALAVGLGVGRYWGAVRESYLQSQLREGQVLRLKQIQDEMVYCMNKNDALDNEVDGLQQTEKMLSEETDLWKKKYKESLLHVDDLEERNRDILTRFEQNKETLEKDQTNWRTDFMKITEAKLAMEKKLNDSLDKVKMVDELYKENEKMKKKLWQTQMDELRTQKRLDKLSHKEYSLTLRLASEITNARNLYKAKQSLLKRLEEAHTMRPLPNIETNNVCDLPKDLTAPTPSTTSAKCHHDLHNIVQLNAEKVELRQQLAEQKTHSKQLENEMAVIAKKIENLEVLDASVKHKLKTENNVLRNENDDLKEEVIRLKYFQHPGNGNKKEPVDDLKNENNFLRTENDDLKEEMTKMKYVQHPGNSEGNYDEEEKVSTIDEDGFADEIAGKMDDNHDDSEKTTNNEKEKFDKLFDQVFDKTFETMTKITDRIGTTWDTFKNISSKVYREKMNETQKDALKFFRKLQNKTGSFIEKNIPSMKKGFQKMSEAVAARMSGAAHFGEKIHKQFDQVKKSVEENLPKAEEVKHAIKNGFQKVKESVKKKWMDVKDHVKKSKWFKKRKNKKNEDFCKSSSKKKCKLIEGLLKMKDIVSHIGLEEFYKMNHNDVDDLYDDFKDINKKIDKCKHLGNEQKQWLSCQFKWWRGIFLKKGLSMEDVAGCGDNLLQWQYYVLDPKRFPHQSRDRRQWQGFGEEHKGLEFEDADGNWFLKRQYAHQTYGSHGNTGHFKMGQTKRRDYNADGNDDPRGDWYFRHRSGPQKPDASWQFERAKSRESHHDDDRDTEWIYKKDKLTGHQHHRRHTNGDHEYWNLPFDFGDFPLNLRVDPRTVWRNIFENVEC